MLHSPLWLHPLGLAQTIGSCQKQLPCVLADPRDWISEADQIGASLMAAVGAGKGKESRG